MVDINLLTEGVSAPESRVHLLVVEIQNRSQARCLLDRFAVKFPPEDADQVGDESMSDPSPSASAFRQKSYQLAAGEVAHFLLAWSPVPLNLSGIVMNDCATRDAMTLNWGMPGETKRVLEVRHLWIQVCGQLYRSSYRAGPYVSGEPIAAEWMEHDRVKSSDFVAPIASVARATAASPGPVVALRAFYDVQYLKGSFESGYSGYFELFLRVASPANAACPFSSLRKREADGQTVIYLNHCQDRDMRAVSPTRETRLILATLGMLPERVGTVEYSVSSEVMHDGSVVLARSQFDVSVRDPKQPMLPAIDTSMQGCQASQLKVSAPEELGDHWKQPRIHPPAGQEWHDGKVFEVTNVSNQSCLLGGVPELKFLEPPEVKSGGLTIPVCRNCGTPLFNPRDSQWIDLKPNDSAHFMVARTMFDADHWFACTVIGGLDMTLPGDPQSMRLPFDAGSCDVGVSAWRAGRYDGDPMNLQYDREEKAREDKRVAAAKPVPEECAKSVSADTGSPVMFPSRGPLTLGVSTKTTHYGEPIPVLLWLSNPTDTAQPVWSCGGIIDDFWYSGMDVFDSAGHRVLSRDEEKQRKSGTLPTQRVQVCGSTVETYIPAHACTHSTFSSQASYVSHDLHKYYELPPGRYFIVPAERTKDGEPVRRTVIDPTGGLAIVVLEQ